MNTTEWISVKDRVPIHGLPVLIVFGPNRTIGLAACYHETGGEKWLDTVTGCQLYKPDFWQELPMAPEPPDPFDVFWETQRVMRLSKAASATYLVARHEAKQIWDAAVASAKKL